MRLYPRMAGQNIVRQRRFFYPYLLTVIGTVAAFYIICAVGTDEGMQNLRGAEYAVTMAKVGVWVMAFFCAIFLFYTNSFLMKRRTREIGLYNILGMEKRHIAAIMTTETLIVWGIGLAAGLLCGILFSKLATLALFRLIDFDVPFGFSVSIPAIVLTAGLFLGILFLILLSNLVRVGRAKPIDLLHSQNAGEREPKTRWLLTILGIVSLAGGYAIALVVDDAFSALGLYFVAVILVIIGTYCLFTAVSIAALKLLRRRKNYYYKPSHFINVSGMLYRMKQNAVGLANICILATMVLVMVSGTLSLYFGGKAAVDRLLPADVVVDVTTQGDWNAESAPTALAWLSDRMEENDIPVTDARAATYVRFVVVRDGDTLTIDTQGSAPIDLCVMTRDEYAAATGQDVPELSEGEAFLAGNELNWNPETITLTGGGKTLEFDVAAHYDDGFVSSLEISSVAKASTLVVADETVFDTINQMQIGVYDRFASDVKWEAQINTSADFASHRTEGAETAFDVKLMAEAELVEYLSARKDLPWKQLSISTRAAAREEMTGASGGFLFLGVFLGLVFMMAAVLIIYYKQVGEGYEDRERFRIMQQVGMEKRQIKRCIDAQILTVFFLPLIVAAVHVAFDFRLMELLLSLFGIGTSPVTLACTLAAFAVFALLYAGVYKLTARTYNKIVAS